MPKNSPAPDTLAAGPGYHVAFAAGGGVLALAMLVFLFFINAKRTDAA